MANILNTLLTTIQTELRGLTLTSSDAEVKDIADSAIVIRKLALRERDFEVGKLTEEKPGILVVHSNTEMPPNGGVNNAQDVYYSFDLVIINQDNWQKEAGIATYTQWEQTIARYFNHNSTVSWPNNADGVVWDTWALGAESVNDWRWVTHGEAAMGVRVRIVSREPQGQ